MPNRQIFSKQKIIIDFSPEVWIYENAVKDYTEAITREPTNVEFYSKRSTAYQKLGKEDLSMKDDMKVFHLKDEKESVVNNDDSTQTSDKLKNIETISGGIINGKAIDLPKPEYPAAAKAVRASGAVNVQVTVDEQGKVISASAVSGHPLLRAAAEQAARKAKFSLTKLSGTPVKVTGAIVYNFTP